VSKNAMLAIALPGSLPDSIIQVTAPQVFTPFPTATNTAEVLVEKLLEKPWGIRHRGQSSMASGAGRF
jgi:hypothetical protein